MSGKKPTQHEIDAQAHLDAQYQPSHYLNQGRGKTNQQSAQKNDGSFGRVVLLGVVIGGIVWYMNQQPPLPTSAPQTDNPNIIRFNDK